MLLCLESKLYKLNDTVAFQVKKEIKEHGRTIDLMHRSIYQKEMTKKRIDSQAGQRGRHLNMDVCSDKLIAGFVLLVLIILRVNRFIWRWNLQIYSIFQLGKICSASVYVYLSLIKRTWSEHIAYIQRVITQVLSSQAD